MFVGHATTPRDYLAEQFRLLQSQRVASMAMEYERWRRLPVEHGDESDFFRQRLTVEADRSTGLILVTYTAPDAATAQTAVEDVKP